MDDGLQRVLGSKAAGCAQKRTDAAANFDALSSLLAGIQAAADASVVQAGRKRQRQDDREHEKGRERECLPAVFRFIL